MYGVGSVHLVGLTDSLLRRRCKRSAKGKGNTPVDGMLAEAGLLLVSAGGFLRISLPLSMYFRSPFFPLTPFFLLLAK